MRTLVVEDSQSIRGLLESVLGERGHQVVAVETGEQGLESHQREPFELMLLDLILPGMDGEQLVRRVREGEDGDRPVIVAFTGQQSPEVLVRLLQHGIDDFLTKPLSPDELSRRILIAEAHVRQGRQRRRLELSLAVRAAHRLNNPLGAVMANLQLIAERIESLGDEAAELRALIGDASEGAERMSGIVRDLIVQGGDSERPTDAPAPLSPNQRDPLRVLVVDDEALVARSLRRALKGHEVVVAESGCAAVEMLRHGDVFDVVLCDLMMPDLSGMEVFQRVRERRPDVAARFVFMTGGAFSPGAVRFLAQVPNERLEKPFAIDRVRALVHAVAASNDS